MKWFTEEEQEVKIIIFRENSSKTLKTKNRSNSKNIIDSFPSIAIDNKKQLGVRVKKEPAQNIQNKWKKYLQ